jgi:hypothetical protein
MKETAVILRVEVTSWFDTEHWVGCVFSMFCIVRHYVQRVK